ncbi:MAG: hypothetical protein ACRCYU_12915, partial [Nocardioides sp.]
GLPRGYVVMRSSGLPLLGLLAGASLIIGGSWRPLLPAIGAAVAVVLAFAAFGFYLWEAFPVLGVRYWQGIAHRRPPEYWMWANLSALAFSAGPMAYAGVAHAVARSRRLRRTLGDQRDRSHPHDHLEHGRRVIQRLAGAAIAMVVVANLSQMSRAEVERIWLPFVPWLLISCALLPERWRRWGLAGQIVVALVVQHTLRTHW